MKRDDCAARRPIIGVMTGSFHTDYSRLITEAICRRLKDADMDVLLFQGLDASRYLNIEGYVDKGFDRHYYSQFAYSRFLRPDLLIVSFSTISAVPNPLSPAEFRALVPDVPMILLETDAEVPNGMHIFFDNYRGMCSCVEHLICDHGCRRIFCVSGPRGVADAELRLGAYRDTMRRHGLDAGEDTVVYGDFTDQVDPLIEDILARCPRPDAIVCANDEMAESAYRVLCAHGLRPGVDVAVTGFDDNTAAHMMDPPLSSVRQSKEALADQVMRAVHAFLRGETPASVTLQAEFMRRESCGCPPSREAAPGYTLAPGQNQAMLDRQIIKNLSRESMLSALLLRNLLDQNITVHGFLRRLGGVLHRLGAEESWIALLEEPVSVSGAQRLQLPDRLRLHMVQRGEQVRCWSRRDAPVLRADEADPAVTLCRPQGPEQKDAVFPLFYDERHYGVLGVRLTQNDMLLYYTVSLQIGTGLRYLFMALAEQEMRAALEEKNQILDFSASHDNLTGLYNRVGVINHIYDYLRAMGQDRRYAAVMADLDHLKQINDAFGHSMGDHAIRKAAELLRQALPAGAPLGRSGGDEFMAIFLAEEDSPAAFCRRLKEACQAYNEQEQTPFFEELSVGCHVFELNKGTDIPAVFRKADALLYLDKKQRRCSVLREEKT